MDTPLVSVILPTYNGARFIREAIESVLSQEYSNLEMIIIDDASTDATPKIIEEYMMCDSRIIKLHNEQNMKLVASLNRGIEAARWMYIARIDDDDIWIDPKKLSKQLAYFRENPSLAVVGTFASVIDEEGEETGIQIIHASSVSDVRRGFWLRNQLVHTSILAKKSILLEVWLYRSEWLYVEDFDLWLRILSAGHEIANIPEYSVEYRVREGNTTNQKYHRMQWLTFLRLFRDNAIYSSFSRRVSCLFVRAFLVILPRSVIGFGRRSRSSDA